jgi:hypothetical protein
LQWQRIEAVWIPTNEQHLVLRAFAEDTLGVNIVKLLEHTPMDELTLALYWQNLSPGAQKYTYCMQFGIRTDLSGNVIFGRYDPKGCGTPFDGALVRLDTRSAADPFEGAVKRPLSKSRTESWKSKFSMKSRTDSWMSRFSKKSKSSGPPDRGQDSSRRPPSSKKKLVSPLTSSSLDQKEYVAAKSRVETTRVCNAGTGVFMTPSTGMISLSSGILVDDDWVDLGLEGSIEVQDSAQNSKDRNGEAAAEGINDPSSLQSKDIEGSSGQLSSTKRYDFGLRKGRDIPPHSKDVSAGQIKNELTTLSCSTSVPSKPPKDRKLLGEDGKHSLMPHEEGQNTPLSDNLVPATLDLPKQKAHSTGSKYSRSSSAYNAPPSDSSGDSGDEKRPRSKSSSKSKSKQIGERLVVQKSDISSLEPGEMQDHGDEIPIVTEIFRHSPNRPLGSQPDTSIAAEQPPAHGENVSESMKRSREAGPSSAPLNEQLIEQNTVSEHSLKQPSSSRKKHTRKRRKPADLISPKRIPRSASDNVELTPAPDADEHWTWDDDVNAYFHVDSDTGSVIWFEDSGSEDNARA